MNTNETKGRFFLPFFPWGDKMDLGKRIKIIDSMKDEYLQFWRQVVNCESPTEFKTGVDMCSKCSRQFCVKNHRNFLCGWYNSNGQTAQQSQVCRKSIC